MIKFGKEATELMGAIKKYVNGGYKVSDKSFPTKASLEMIINTEKLEGDDVLLKDKRGRAKIDSADKAKKRLKEMITEYDEGNYLSYKAAVKGTASISKHFTVCMNVIDFLDAIEYL